jgi:cobalt-zinc-cadmium efflux system outer membrane protein
VADIRVTARRLLALLLVLPSGRALAQGLTVTLAAARTQADRVAPPVELAERQAEVARTEVSVAGTFANPVATVQTSKETARLITGLSLPLPLFGQRGKAVDAARADADAIAQEREVARLTARWSVTNAWLELWAAQERAQVLALSSGDARRLLDVARERLQAGSAPRLDVVRATADSARALAETAAAQALIDATAARLVPWVGGDPARSSPRAAGRPPLPEALPPLEEIARRALAQHPLLRRDRAQVVAAGAHLQLEQRLRVPLPSAEVTVAHQDRSNDNRTDVIGGLSFELPLLSLRGGAIGRARAQQGAAQSALTLDQRQLTADIADAYHSTRAAAARSRALATAVLPAMEEARRMTEDGYREGRLDILRLLEAQRAVLDARLANLEAVVAWGRALADLERSAGVALYGNGNGR